MTVENVSSPVNKKALFEYDGPAIASVTPSVVPCVGGKRIIIDGTSFGENTETEDMAVLVGGKDCAPELLFAKSNFPNNTKFSDIFIFL